jgi:glucan phosphorylase
LDSLATLNYPAWGYGLRYKYGLFHQEIDKDGQHEVVENWLEVARTLQTFAHQESVIDKLEAIQVFESCRLITSKG